MLRYRKYEVQDVTYVKKTVVLTPDNSTYRRQCCNLASLSDLT